MEDPLSRRSLLRMSGALAATGALSACGGSYAGTAPPALPRVDGEYDGPPVVLRYWIPLGGGDTPYMRALVEDFSATHPAIDVEMYANPESYYQKFPLAVSSGLAPDVGLVHSYHVATNAARGVLLPLDDVVDGLGLAEGDFVDTVWGAGVYGGRRYALPLDVWPDSLFYNRTVLAAAGLDPDDPPRDRAAYEAALEQLAGAGVQGHWMPAVDSQAVGRGFDSILWQLGGELYDEDGAVPRFDSAEGLEAVRWQIERVRRGQSPPAVGAFDANVAFKNDRNAFLWGGPGALINDLGSVEGLDWDVVPLPTIGDRPAGFSGSHQLALMRPPEVDDDRFAASVAFVTWLSANSVRWAEAGPLPARREVLESEEFAALEAQSKIAEALPTVRFYPLVPGIAEVQTTILYPAVASAVLQREPPEEALGRAARQAAQLLEENRQKYAGSR